MKLYPTKNMRKYETVMYGLLGDDKCLTCRAISCSSSPVLKVCLMSSEYFRTNSELLFSDFFGNCKRKEQKCNSDFYFTGLLYNEIVFFAYSRSEAK